jgi:multisubunit Na+/H+ antiporter MnhE subunit
MSGESAGSPATVPGVDAALNSDQVATIGLGVIIGLIVVGIVLSIVISALIGRIITIVVFAALVTVVWVNRNTVADHIKDCNAHVSFFGVHVDLSSSAEQKCLQFTNH